VKAKLLALLLGLGLIGAAYYFRSPAPAASATVQKEVEEEPESTGRPANPLARPPVFQTAAYHPNEYLEDSRESALPPLTREEAMSHWNSISVLVTCATAPENCAISNIPDTDPSSRFFSIRDRILDELDWFVAHQTTGAQSASVVQAAQSLLTIQDDQVQCRSLDLLLTQPASTGTPGLIAKHMGELVDADCVQKVVRVLRKSLDSSNSRTVTDYVCDTILHGATLSSKEMARNIGGILTAETRGPLEACLAKLPKSERYQSMRDALYPATAI
jgi:hypothetical protein